MFLDVLSQRIQCALDSCGVAFVRSANSKPREKSAAEIVRRKEPVQVAALHASIRRDRAFGCAANAREGTCAIRALGAADMDLIGLDRLLRLGVHGLDS